ncbi:MAG: DUF5606 domain-containing protein [Taibaiella sp.]|nr:DUF5606 domain-containing protein [Taibaiella sp.]
MDYKEIVSVTGIGGLYQLLTSKSDGAIVRNISDKTTKFISARLHNVTPLESIEVYTTGDNVRLHEVFQKMKEAEGSTPAPSDAKKADNNAIKSYFDKVFPDFDQERVYVSDMKKMLKWYHMLKENDLLNFESMAEDEAVEAETAEAEPVAEEKPTAKKKAAKKKTEDVAEEAAEEKPVKKAVKKKAAVKEDGEAKPAPKKAAKKKTEE